MRTGTRPYVPREAGWTGPRCGRGMRLAPTTTTGTSPRGRVPRETLGFQLNHAKSAALCRKGKPQSAPAASHTEKEGFEPSMEEFTPITP